MAKQDNKLYSMTASQFIKEVYQSLQHIALTNFMHDITFGNGEISMLVSNEDLFLFYYKNKIPMLCTDNTGRTLASGIYLNKLLENTHDDCSVLMPLMSKVAKQCGENYGQNSVHIVKRENDCQHLYSLFFDLNENDFLHWIINNGNFLSDIIDNYNFVAKDIILEAKAPESRIVLPNSINTSFSNLINPSSSVITHLSVIHKTLNSPVFLSKQQSRCLLLLMKGKTAKQIAMDMKLSPRTVEHYFVIIRNLLGCASNKELIIVYAEQLKAFIK